MLSIGLLLDKEGSDVPSSTGDDGILPGESADHFISLFYGE